MQKRPLKNPERVTTASHRASAGRIQCWFLKSGDGQQGRAYNRRNHDRLWQLVPAAHVRRCSRRLCGRWRRCDRGLTGCGRARRWLARAGDQGQAYDCYGTAQ